MSLILWFFLISAVLQTRAPAPPQTAAGRASISGVAVRAEGAPETKYLANVAVELRPGGTISTTDGRGRFMFRNLAPGYYTLVPRKDGFVPQKDAGRGLTELGMMLRVTAGDVVTNLELPMIPAPAITGFVYHPNGEPLAAAVVQAHARHYTPFGPQVRVIRRVLSNDLGEYRLHWLSFGDYIVSAGHGDRIRNSALAGVRLSPNVSRADEGYNTMFYGGTNPGDARDVRVGPGLDAGGVNIVLSDVARFRVQGQLVSAGAVPGDVQIAFVPSGVGLVDDGDYSIKADPGGAFEINGVSPGNYVLLARGSRMASDLVRARVGNTDVEGLRIPLFPMTTVDGRVASAGPSRPAETRIQLVRRSLEVEDRVETAPNKDGRFTVDAGVGEYDVYLEGLNPSEYIRNIRYFGVDGLRTGIRIEGNPNTVLEIEVGVAAGTVEGAVVSNGGRPGAGVQVVLVPEPRFRHRTDRYIVGYADGMGRFSLSAVPSGEYTAFAFEQLESRAYFAFGYSAQLNSRFASWGLQVSVGDKGTPALRLITIPAAETAGGFQ